jgi:hypothetical protein
LLSLNVSGAPMLSICSQLLVSTFASDCGAGLV